jgi:hypothetical protein
MGYLLSEVPVTGLTHRQSEILNIARAFSRVMVEDLAGALRSLHKPFARI